MIKRLFLYGSLAIIYLYFYTPYSVFIDNSKRIFFYGFAIGIILYLVRLISQRTKNQKLKSLLNKKFKVSLNLVFFPFLFLQLICLIAEGGSDFVFWLVTLAISIFCFFLLAYLLKRKENKFLAIILFAVQGFAVGWIVSWIMMLFMTLTGGMSGAGGGGVAIGALIMCIMSTFIGLMFGISEATGKLTKGAI